MAWTEPLREEQWIRLRWLLREWSGMDCPENRRSDLREATAKAARFAGIDHLDALLTKLADPAETVLRSVWISAYTIHETYFFRDAPQWKAIRSRVIPERLEARRQSRTIKIWSAGCSSGEEAYTAAIVLHDMIPDSSWTLKILGTDISSDVLEKARKGIYREWSFRQTPLHVRDDCFEPVTATSWKIRPDIAKPVRFELLNLKTGTYPAPARHLDDIDLILCRNVLIYFAREEMDLVLARLTDSLAPGGFLALGPAEPFPPAHLPLEPIVSEGASLYRRDSNQCSPPRGENRGGGGPAIGNVSRTASTKPERNLDIQPGRTSISLPASSPLPPAGPAKNASVPEPARQAPRGANPPENVGASATPAQEFARKAHEAADGGRWDEALAAAEAAIAADSLHAGSFYIKALALKELGRLDESRDALRRCLFIEKGHWMGHLLAAGLWQREGMPDRARSHLNAILSGLVSLDPGAILPDTGGINVGRMRALAESQLRHLEGRN